MKSERRYLSLSLDDNFFNRTLVLLQVQVVDMTKSHTNKRVSIILCTEQGRHTTVSLFVQEA